MRRNAIDGEQDRDVKHGVGDIWVKNKSIRPHTCSGLTGRGPKKMVTVVASGKGNGRREERDGKEI